MGEQGEAETNQDGVVADPGAELQDSGDKPMLDGVVFSLKVQVHSLGVLPESGMDRTSMAMGPFISLFEQQIGPLSGNGDLVLVIQMLVTAKAIAVYVLREALGEYGNCNCSECGYEGVAVSTLC